jgi:hypothetical protein
MHKKIIILLLIFLFPLNVHADSKERRACILDAVSVRKDSLRNMRQSKKEFRLGIERVVNEAIKKESTQFESAINELKKNRVVEIQKASILPNKDKEHDQLEKIKDEYIQKIESLEEIRDTHIKQINEEYKKSKTDLSLKYKKFTQEIWSTFLDNKNKCAKG